MITIIILRGKGEEVESFSYKCFIDYNEALAFCNELNEKYEDEKHWKYAGIVGEGQIIELSNPHRNPHLKF